MPTFFVNTDDARISNAFLATLGAAPGSTYLAQIKAFGLVNSVNAMIAATGKTTAADLATTITGNLGLTGAAATAGQAYLTSVTLAGASSTWGANLISTLDLFTTLQNDATYGTAASAYVARINSAVAYSAVAGNNSTDLTTLAAAVGSAGSTGAGSTFTLTTNPDAWNGSAGNDLVTGTAGTGATLAAPDILTAGAGTDTLSIISDNNFTILGSNVTGFEKLSVNAYGGAVVTFSGVTGMTDLVNNGSTAALTFGVAAASAGATPNLMNLEVKGATAATVLSYTSTALTGSADVQNLTVNGTGSGTTQRAITLSENTNAPSTNQLETLNITAIGTNGITLTTDATQTSLKTVNISGSGSLALGLAADNIQTSATIIDANAATGNILIGGDTGTTGDAGGNALGAAAHKVTLGAGNDAVFFGATLNSSDTVVGGAGTDVLGLSQAIGATAAATNLAMTNVSGIEVIRFDAGAGLTQDAGASSLAGMSYQLVSAAQTYTLNNLANNASITVLGGAAATTAVTLSLKDSSGLSDALSVAVNNGASNAVTTVTTLTDVTGLETLNLSSAGGTGTNVITTLGATGKVVLTGSAGLTITNGLTTTQFDGSGFAGKLTALLSAATNTNIASGSGKDTITTGTGNDTVNTGSGDDTIINGAAVNDATGADLLYGGAGNDTFLLQGTALAATLTNYSTVLTIKDFTVGSSTSSTDFIKLSDTALYAHATALATGTGATGSTAAAEAVVFQSVAKNAAAAAITASANVIKLTDGVAFTTDFQGTFNAAIGTGTLTGLTTATNHAVLFYDTTNSKMVIAAVLSTAGTGTVLESGDAIKVIGAVDMTAADYASLSAINFAAFG